MGSPAIAGSVPPKRKWPTSETAGCSLVIVIRVLRALLVWAFMIAVATAMLFGALSITSLNRQLMSTDIRLLVALAIAIPSPFFFALYMARIVRLEECRENNDD